MPHRQTFRVFGLDLSASVSLPGLVAASAAGRARTVLELSSPAELAADWPADEAQRRLEHRFQDGSPMIVIDEHPSVGYRVWGDRIGAHVVSGDGERIRCAPDDPDDAKWPPFVVAQVLPLAAVLHGLEVLHASAIALGNAAVAFVGSSGAGKTSLALAMVDRGARFLTDDVLALEVEAAGVVAHPGPAFAAVGERAGPKQTAEPAYEPRTLPLAAVYLLGDRGHDSPVAIEPLREPNRLLGSTFNAIVIDPRRLERVLDLCAAIAAGGVLRSVTGGREGEGAPTLATRIHEDLAAQGVG